MGLTKGQRTRLSKLIDGMDKDGLEEINGIVVDRLRTQRSIANQIASQNFIVGDKVQFKGRRNRTINGSVTKINRTTLIVNTDDTNEQWKVAVSLVEKVA